MPFKALVEIGYWQKDVFRKIPDIWANLFCITTAIEGGADVLSVSMDANVAHNFCRPR